MLTARTAGRRASSLYARAKFTTPALQSATPTTTTTTSSKSFSCLLEGGSQVLHERTGLVL